ncbi:hypothetical protein EJ03DRAFT_271957 [Teratosphaeria nubilosa]|uniref:Uncharacterized protein n=1 Tax=Teratosphaeria nubilosa TaxID=161662 RepID=A0A6G1L9P9_9PEZI|nr:hypothetical protein EJ03DRAFT_271957 [Teratosphaeria nubilosa]
MRLNCFRPSSGSSTLDLHDGPSNLKPRPGSDVSRASTISTVTNESISKLPPCKRLSEAQMDAMMMPVPDEPRASRCLRLSHPKTYSGIVEGMKKAKGSRDWRNFAVFYDDEIDEGRSAIEEAQKRAREYERKWKQLQSFGEASQSTDSDIVDMIG